MKIFLIPSIVTPREPSVCYLSPRPLATNETSVHPIPYILTPMTSITTKGSTATWHKRHNCDKTLYLRPTALYPPGSFFGRGCRVAERGVKSRWCINTWGTDIGGYVPASHRAGAGVQYKRIFHVVEKGGETGVGHVNCLRLGRSD